MNQPSVMIVGAGIGGLTAALALSRSGVPVRVFEAAPALGEVGAGLTLAANASAVLQHLGLAATLNEFAVVPARGAVMHYRTGRVLVDIPRGPETYHHGAPYCQIHRADLHAGLIAALEQQPEVSIELGKALTDLDSHADGVIARFADGSEARGALLVGCDGIRSAVRARLFGADEPRFTGYVAWRGLVPMRLLDPASIVPDSAVWQGPGHFLTRYKIRRGELLNYVGIARAGQWTAEGWSVRSELNELLEEFAEFHAAALDVLRATPADTLFKWGIFDREPLPAWTVGRASLLGDAAHPMTPFLGQGAAMAIEDAMILGRAVALEGPTPAALQRYEQARRERTTRVFLDSRANGERLTTYDPDRFTAAVHRNEETLGLAGYDAAQVPI
jgi:salicylate hydroxylase